MDEPREYLSSPDTPAGLALAMREIRSEGANYLLRVKGFRRVAGWRQLLVWPEDLALGGHSRFLILVERFDEFVSPDRQTRKQKAAVAAIHHASAVISHLNMVGQALPDRVGRSFNWAPASFDALRGEVLASVIGWSTRAFFWAGEFMSVSAVAKAGGDARALKLGTSAAPNWAPHFLTTIRSLCGDRAWTQRALYSEVQKRLGPDFRIPDFEKVQPRMTEWESSDPPAYTRTRRRAKAD